MAVDLQQLLGKLNGMTDAVVALAEHDVRVATLQVLADGCATELLEALVQRSRIATDGTSLKALEAQQHLRCHKRATGALHAPHATTEGRAKLAEGVLGQADLVGKGA